MKKSSLKLYLATFLLTLVLASLSFAGDGQCPFAPPPPPPDGIVIGGNIGIVFSDKYISLNELLEILDRSVNFF